MLFNRVSLATVLRLSLVLAIVMLLSGSLIAQTTVGTGSIVGTLTDPQGAVITGAKVTITNIGTGQVIEL